MLETLSEKQSKKRLAVLLVIAFISCGWAAYVHFHRKTIPINTTAAVVAPTAKFTPLSAVYSVRSNSSPFAPPPSKTGSNNSNNSNPVAGGQPPIPSPGSGLPIAAFSGSGFLGGTGVSIAPEQSIQVKALMSSDGQNAALISTNDKTTTVKEGDTVDSGRVTRIGSDGLWITTSDGNEKYYSITRGSTERGRR